MIYFFWHAWLWTEDLYENELHLSSWHLPVFRYESQELLQGLLGWNYTKKWLYKYVPDIRCDTVEMRSHLKQSINNPSSGNYYWWVMTLNVETCMIQTCNGDICYAHTYFTPVMAPSSPLGCPPPLSHPSGNQCEKTGEPVGCQCNEILLKKQDTFRRQLSIVSQNVPA